MKENEKKPFRLDTEEFLLSFSVLPLPCMRPVYNVHALIAVTCTLHRKLTVIFANSIEHCSVYIFSVQVYNALWLMHWLAKKSILNAHFFYLVWRRREKNTEENATKHKSKSHITCI